MKQAVNMVLFLTTKNIQMKLVLASSSPFRKALLEKLHLDFECDSPDIDETPKANESIENMVKRLSESKAQALAKSHPNALIIGSDQSASLHGNVLHKPGNFETAFEQLKAASGETITFYTGLCLLNTQTQHIETICEPYVVKFRPLDNTEIENYLNRERPFNCAGSFKSEALGISLFDSMQGDDPNTLIGLPLIKLCRMLKEQGMPVI